jgi:hypothetical protein
MAWQLQGTYLENCNCDLVCPCSISFFAQRADNERCQVALFFHVEAGEADGVDLSGLTVCVIGDTPAQMGDGNWRVGVLMDEAASQEQQEKLGAIFGGQAGGPMEALAGLIGENLGVETVPIEFERRNGGIHAKAGDLVEIELETLVLGEDGSGEPVRISGIPFPAPTVTAARPRTSRISAFGLDISNDGDKNAFWAPFSWQA